MTIRSVPDSFEFKLKLNKQEALMLAFMFEAVTQHFYMMPEQTEFISNLMEQLGEQAIKFRKEQKKVTEQLRKQIDSIDKRGE